MKRTFLAALVALLVTSNLQAQDTVTTTGTAPTTDLIASQANGGSQYLVDALRDPGQGQTFSLASDFTIDAITVQIGTDTRGAQGDMEDAAALSLNVHLVPVDPATGAPPLDPVTGNPVLTLDATTILASFNDPNAGTFDATMADTTPLYLTFDLDPASTASLGTLSANTLYAFTITTTSATDPGFRIERSLTDDFADGNGVFTGGNGIPTLRGPDDLLFFMQGTAAQTFDVGDVNCDGSINFLDITPFIAAIAAGTPNDKADINGDGVVNFLDIQGFIALL